MTSDYSVPIPDLIRNYPGADFAVETVENITGREVHYQRTGPVIPGVGGEGWLTGLRQGEDSVNPDNTFAFQESGIGEFLANTTTGTRDEQQAGTQSIEGLIKLALGGLLTIALVVTLGQLFNINLFIGDGE